MPSEKVAENVELEYAHDAVAAAIDAQTLSASQGVEGEPLLDLPLPYARQVLHEVLMEDQLVLLSPGLGLHWIIAAFVLIADVAGTHRATPAATVPRDKENLVLIVGASPEDIDSLTRHIRRLSRGTNLKTRGLALLNTDVDSESRASAYAAGGVYFVTSEILIPDMLKGTIPSDKITGIVIMNAHRATETNKLAFLVKLYRDQNQDGFIKAFSDHPELISFSINGLANKLRYLGVQRIGLWPRFHLLVRESLQDQTVTEVIVEPSESMREIAQILSLLTSSLISDVKRRAGALVENEHWNVNNALVSNLPQTIRSNLSGHWHRLSPEAKHAIHELSQMQDLNRALTTLEPSEFYKLYISKMLAKGEGRDQPPIWALHELADKLAVLALERVNNREEMPKWPHLMDLLRNNSGKTVLLMCNSSKVLGQLVKLIHYPDDLASRSKTEFDSASSDEFFMKTSAQTRARQAREEEAAARAALNPYKRRRVRGNSQAAAAMTREESSVLNTKVKEEEEEEDVKPDVEILSTVIRNALPEPVERKRFLLSQDDQVVDLTEEPEANSSSQPTSLSTNVYIRLYGSDEVLEEVSPDVVIMYDLNLKFIRELEVYEAITKRELSVNLMYYQHTVEELLYLNEVRREKDAFTSLIREKAEMPMTFKEHADRDSETRIVTTREGGTGQQRVVVGRPRVIVDAREFRSELPHLVWSEKMDVIPLSLLVGDYILSPEIAVERKSVADLRESFINGRLVDQIKKMQKSYKRPMLLIEFSNHSTFSFETFEELRARSVRRELLDKLLILLLAFPNLRVIWSASPRHSAEMFKALKQATREPEPDEAQALQAGKVEVKNYTAVDMLRAMPGVTARNYLYIMEKIDSLADLANMSEKDLADIIGTECARKLTVFLDKKFSAT